MLLKVKKNRKGFTLIELIIVVAILAILAAVAVPSFVGLTKKANDGVAIANASSLASAVNVVNAMAGDTPTITAKGANYAALSALIGADLMPTIPLDQQTAAFTRLVIDNTTGVASVDTTPTP